MDRCAVRRKEGPVGSHAGQCGGDSRIINSLGHTLKEDYSMARPWKPHDFDSVYEHYICQDEMQFGGRDYHLRYRSRYKECARRLAALAPPHPVDVLDVGGGQLGVLCSKLWNDS